MQELCNNYILRGHLQTNYCHYDANGKGFGLAWHDTISASLSLCTSWTPHAVGAAEGYLLWDPMNNLLNI